MSRIETVPPAGESRAYRAELFPTGALDHALDDLLPPRPRVGVCLSGGGARAVAAAMGQLRALRSLGLLARTAFLSAVSGGSWAAIPYTYLPRRIDGRPVTDDDFLGEVVDDPSALRWCGRSGVPPARQLASLSPNSLGHVPVRLGYADIIARMIELREELGLPLSQLWSRAIGEVILEPYGLLLANREGEPRRFVGYDTTRVEQRIRPENPELGPDDFFLYERQRPFLLVNASMFLANPWGDDPAEVLVPVHANPLFAGILPTFPGRGRHGADVGGGGVASFGFNSTLEAASARRATVRPAWRFSLSDIAAISGAVPAETIEEHLHRTFAEDLIPSGPYWPVQGAGDASPAPTHTYRFADGGSLENTGIGSLLAYPQVERIIAFVNSEVPLRRTGSFVVADEIPPLFGFQPSPEGADWERYPSDPAAPASSPLQRFNQVFESDRGEFFALLEGLWNAAGGPARRSPALFEQELRVRENPWFAVSSGEGRRTVRVLWVYLQGVAEWWARLRRSVRLAARLDPLRYGDFPNYGTYTKFHLDARQVNLLAHHTCWCVRRNAQRFEAMYVPG